MSASPQLAATSVPTQPVTIPSNIQQPVLPAEKSRKVLYFGEWKKRIPSWPENGFVPVYDTCKLKTLRNASGAKIVNGNCTLLCTVDKLTQNLESIIKEGRLAAMHIQNGKIKTIAFHSFLKKYVDLPVCDKHFMLTDDSLQVSTVFSSVLTSFEQFSDAQYREFSEAVLKAQK